MKISQFQLLANLQRETLIPVSIHGKNLKITLGQILDASAAAIVPFATVQDRPSSVNIVNGSDTVAQRSVIFDTQDNRFYMAIHNAMSDQTGNTIDNWTYYRNWEGSANFFNADGEVREDAIFCDAQGRFFSFNGTTLTRAGISDAEARLIEMADWLEVATEEDMENLINAGITADDRIRFIPEEQ